jgi:hypothetical protein
MVAPTIEARRRRVSEHETELGSDIEGGVPGYGRTVDEAVADAFDRGKGILSPGWLVVAATFVRVENPIREYKVIVTPGGGT